MKSKKILSDIKCVVFVTFANWENKNFDGNHFLCSRVTRSRDAPSCMKP